MLTKAAFIDQNKVKTVKYNIVKTYYNVKYILNCNLFLWWLNFQQPLPQSCHMILSIHLIFPVIMLKK